MNYDIITVGSATVDIFIRSPQEKRVHGSHRDVAYPLGDKILISQMQIMGGGGGMNAAVGFARLGFKTGFLGCIGTDIHGGFISDILKKERVHYLGRRAKGMSGYSIILLSDTDRTILTYKGLNNEIAANTLWADAKWMYVGTLLGKSEMSGRRLITRASQAGVSIAANISSYEAKQRLPKLKGFLSCCDVLILNADEARLLTKEKDTFAILRQIKKYVKKLVVITDGPRVVHALDNNKSYVQKVPHVNIVSSAGAGDAFAVGCVAALMRGKDTQTALQWGLKESQSVLKHLGAQTGLLRRI